MITESSQLSPNVSSRLEDPSTTHQSPAVNSARGFSEWIVCKNRTKMHIIKNRFNLHSEVQTAAEVIKDKRPNLVLV